MSVWEEYRTLGNRLSKRLDEGSMRSGVSRFYFAAHNVTREYLATVGVIHRDPSFQPRGGVKDRALTHLCEVSSSSELNRVGIELHRLYYAQQEVDYATTIADLQTLAKNAADQCTTICSSIPIKLDPSETTKLKALVDAARSDNVTLYDKMKGLGLL